jgi:hypothetical protein
MRVRFTHLPLYSWIGGSSTMTLIETFRNETADDEDFRATPSSDQSDAQNMLYFPTGLGFGKLKALPLADEVEYPERDLADKLVRFPFAPAHMMTCPTNRPSNTPPPGGCLFRARAFSTPRVRPTFLFGTIPTPHGQQRDGRKARLRRSRVRRVCMRCEVFGRPKNQVDPLQ